MTKNKYETNYKFKYIIISILIFLNILFSKNN